MSGAADITEQLAAPDDVARAHLGRPFKVGVERAVAVAMVEHDEVAVARVVILDERHAAISGGEHRPAALRANIDPQRVSGAKHAGDHAAHRPGEERPRAGVRRRVVRRLVGGRLVGGGDAVRREDQRTRVNAFRRVTVVGVSVKHWLGICGTLLDQRILPARQIGA